MTTGRPRMFRLGAMRHRITIQSPTETLDAYGEPVVTWSNYLVDEPAAFTPLSGLESFRGRQYEASTNAIFTVRYRDGYDTKMRILHDGNQYGISSIRKVDGYNAYVELQTKAAGDL